MVGCQARSILSFWPIQIQSVTSIIAIIFLREDVSRAKMCTICKIYGKDSVSSLDSNVVRSLMRTVLRFFL